MHPSVPGCRRLLAATGVAVLLVSSPLPAQVAPGAGGGTAGQATLVPLSGRGSQGGAVVITRTALPGATTSVNTVTPIVQPQGPLLGSVAGDREMSSGRLTLREAVRRGMLYNLGSVSLDQVVTQARSRRIIARSALLPNLVGDLTATVQQLNLEAMGFQFGDAFADFSIPSIVGPFQFIDLRARVTQTVFDLTAWNNYRASKETERASELSADDIRDLVVLGVGGAYLQTAAARARVDSARAQLETATALHRQTAERRDVGLVAQVDVDRSEIQALAQEQRMAALRNDFAKQKINLARMVGLPPTDGYALAHDVPFAPLAVPGVDVVLEQARAGRADLAAAAAQVRAAERALDAARAERLPTVAVSADFGTIGRTLADSHSTFAASGRVRMPLWAGGRTAGHVLQAEAAVAQRVAELDDLSTRIEGEVRSVLLDLEAAAAQVSLAGRNVEVATRALELTRQRFEAGVDDNVGVVQAQEALAVAELDYINAVFSHNVGKLNLAKATGQVAARLTEFLELPD